MRSAPLALLVLALLAIGCQPAGPGIAVNVRAEPKKGYTPPEDPEYGGDSGPVQPAGHAFHRIDYRQLAGIVVWVEPLGGAGVLSGAPLNATVNVSSDKAANPDDFNVEVASVGGTISLAGSSGAYILRTQAGDVMDAKPGQPVSASKPGLIEIISDSSDDVVGRVYVTPTSRARKAVNGQRVSFAPLPPGQYRVSTWHPILPGTSQVVDVAEGKMSTLTLTVGVNALPKAGK
jgi:hypothetical protein